MPRRSRPAAVVLAAVSVVMLLAGCSQNQQPREYGEQYEKNLMIGCTGVEPNDQGKYRNPTLGSAAYCQCVYKGLVEKVPFDDAKKFEEQQAEEKAGEITVPKNIASVYDACKKAHPEGAA
ncbi:MAG: hypothetical protein ACOYOP_00850 [Microthrixaceae bacterium]